MIPAVILAAGRGRRMGRLTDTVPKPLLEAGGRPILLSTLDALRAAGIDEVHLVVGYRERQIRAAAAAWAEQQGDLQLLFHRQPRPLGTAHALHCAAPGLGGRGCVLLLGDLLVGAAAIEALLDVAGGGVEAVVAVDRREDPSRGAAVRVDDGWRVLGIVEKPAPGSAVSRWNNTGLYVLPPSAVVLAGEVERSERGEHELPDVIGTLVGRGELVQAVEVTDWVLHVGRPEDLEAVEAR